MTEEQPADDKIADDIDDFMKGLEDTLKSDEIDVVDDLKRQVEESTEVTIHNFHTHALRPCRKITVFKRLNTLGEGTYGKVYRAQDTEADGAIKAVKMIKLEHTKDDSFPKYILREINTLLSCEHENIVQVLEVCCGEKDEEVYLIMEYVETDVKMWMQSLECSHGSGALSVPCVKNILRQLLRAVAYMHRNWIVHRDLKTSNLLISLGGILKVCDFGLARNFSGAGSCHMTPVIMTMYYRSPEVVFQHMRSYSSAMDIWSVGVIFMELLLGYCPFRCENETALIAKFIDLLGVPGNVKDLYPTNLAQEMLPDTIPKGGITHKLSTLFGDKLSQLGKDFLCVLLAWNPADRWSAEDLLNHPYLTGVGAPTEPLACPNSDLPSITEAIAMPRRRRERNVVKRSRSRDKEAEEEDRRNPPEKPILSGPVPIGDGSGVLIGVSEDNANANANHKIAPQDDKPGMAQSLQVSEPAQSFGRGVTPEPLPPPPVVSLPAERGSASGRAKRSRSPEKEPSLTEFHSTSNMVPKGDSANTQAAPVALQTQEASVALNLSTDLLQSENNQKPDPPSLPLNDVTKEATPIMKIMNNENCGKEVEDPVKKRRAALECAMREAQEEEKKKKEELEARAEESWKRDLEELQAKKKKEELEAQKKKEELEAKKKSEELEAMKRHLEELEAKKKKEELEAKKKAEALAEEQQKMLEKLEQIEKDRKLRELEIAQRRKSEIEADKKRAAAEAAVGIPPAPSQVVSPTAVSAPATPGPKKKWWS